MGRHTLYIVSLSQEEKNKLQAMSKDNKLAARVSKRVLILLALDDKKNSNLNHRQIASALNTTVTIIVATARDYFQNGLEHIPPDDIETAFESETGTSAGCSSLSTPPASQEKRSLSF